MITQDINIFAKKNIDNDEKVLLSPLCDIYNNPDISSNYERWFNDLDVTKFNSHGLFPYLPSTDINTILSDNSRIIWSIVIAQGEIRRSGIGKYIHIGNISLQRIDLINRSAEIACLIGEKKYWNKGIMTWALSHLIDHGFLRLGLNRIWSGTALVNNGMRKVFEKLKFTPEGTFKEGMFLNGGFIDVISFGLLEKDWLSNFHTNDKSDVLSTIRKTQLDNISKKIDEEIVSDYQQDLINTIEQIRSQNNINWMDLVRLAFKKSPNEAQAIMQKIVKCDEDIKNNSQKLANTK